jgi:hypothetical protein
VLVSTTYSKSSSNHVWIWLHNRSRENGFLFFMQQLELKSIYILCRNCSFSHKERNKIGLQFWIFLRFYMIFPRFSTRGQSLTFGFTNRSLDFTVRPLEGNHLLQLGPWARPPAGIAGIRPREGRDWPGKWSGMMRDSPRVDLRGWKRREVLRRASSVVPWMGSRGSFCSGE